VQVLASAPALIYSRTAGGLIDQQSECDLELALLNQVLP